jgi:hypothetical protein
MLSLKESSTVTALAAVLYEFLPGSGNANTSFPLAAERAGIGELWRPASKMPAIVHLLTETLEHRQDKFCSLIVAVVQQSIAWRRRKANPLTREEIEKLNALLPGVGFKIPDLLDAQFLNTLPSSKQPGKTPDGTGSPPDAARLAALASELVNLTALAPHPRGFAFEKFLKNLLDAYGMSARASFRLVGEQIDGSFELAGETYLLEAKWENARTGAAPLHAFAGKVGGKAAWSRGLFISQAGFSDDGIEAYSRGRPTPIICLDGLDLYDTLSRNLRLDEVIASKVRRAAETGSPFARVRELFPQ